MKHPIRIAILVVATIALLFLFLRNSDPSEVVAQLRALDPLWLTVALLTNFTALLCRATRWRILLSSTEKPGFYPTFFATTVGFMSSAILPIRAGDVIRPALLSRKTPIRFSSALGTVFIEKILDTTAVLTLFSAFVLLRGRAFLEDPRIGAKGGVVISLGIIAALLLCGLITMVLAVVFLKERTRRLLMTVSSRFPARVQSGTLSFYESFQRALQLVKDRSKLLRVVLLTCGVWLCLTGQFYFASFALGKPLPYSASILVTGFSILGLMIPTPGGVGGFHKACQIALTNYYFFSVSASVAVAVVFHIVGTLPVVTTGTILILREGISLRQLARFGEKEDE